MKGMTTQLDEDIMQDSAKMPESERENSSVFVPLCHKNRRTQARRP